MNRNFGRSSAIGVSGALRTLLLLMACAATLVTSPAVASAFDEFFLAAKKDDSATVQRLLRRGLDPNMVEPVRLETAMMLALREGAMASFDVLMRARGVDVNVKARNGDTALMIAAYKGNVAGVQALLARKAIVNRPGWTALHYGAAAGNNEIVQALLDQHAYIDAASPNRTTPIMMAALNGHIYTVKLLLDAGADATLRNAAGLTAIDIARQFGHQEIVEGLTWRLKRAGKL